MCGKGAIGDHQVPHFTGGCSLVHLRIQMVSRDKNVMVNSGRERYQLEDGPREGGQITILTMILY